jgi:hypothetical protein
LEVSSTRSLQNTLFKVLKTTEDVGLGVYGVHQWDISNRQFLSLSTAQVVVELREAPS